MKTCTRCGAVYDLAAWRELPLRGHMDDRDQHPEDGERLELRDCPCGTTLSIRLCERWAWQAWEAAERQRAELTAALASGSAIAASARTSSRATHRRTRRTTDHGGAPC